MKRLDDLDLKQQADTDFTGDGFTSRFAGTWVPPKNRFTSNKEAEDWTTIEPDNIHIATGPDTIREEIDTWLDVYGIESRYKAKCCGDDDGKYWIEQVLDEWTYDAKTPEGFLSTLSRQARSKPFAEANFLKLAFLEGCHRSGLFT